MSNDLAEVVKYAVIMSTVARIGAVLLLIFGIQILVTLYKYNTRLAAYYDARADALELVGENDEHVLETLVRALSPESLDFSVLPQSPTRDIADLAKSVSPFK